MDRINIIGIDISKRSFQLHGATAEGKPVFGKKLSRESSSYSSPKYRRAWL